MAVDARATLMALINRELGLGDLGAGVGRKSDYGAAATAHSAHSGELAISPLLLLLVVVRLQDSQEPGTSAVVQLAVYHVRGVLVKFDRVII